MSKVNQNKALKKLFKEILKNRGWLEYARNDNCQIGLSIRIPDGVTKELVICVSKAVGSKCDIDLELTKKIFNQW